MSCDLHMKENCNWCGPDADALDRIQSAITHVADICAGRKKWRMSIPVRPDDSDATICGALRTAREEIKRLRGKVEERSV